MNRSDVLERIRSAKRIVVKVGTSLLTDSADSEGVHRDMIAKLREEILFLRGRGAQVILVSSGAVGLGRTTVKRFPGATGAAATEKLARRQALSALGQGRLIATYAKTFEPDGIPVAQLLLTARDFGDRRAYLNIGHTLHELLALGALPVVNENDTVSTEELRFGDNDLLSAACASLFGADLLVILTSVEGFIVEGARVPYLESVPESQMKHALGPSGPGSGGMETKMRAGQLCLLGGEALAILPGRMSSPVQALFRGDDIGTIVAGPVPARTLSARQRWLLYARTEGSLVIDQGARSALVERGSSLLPVGVREVRGRFLAGDLVEVLDEEGRILGRGVVNYSAQEVTAGIGRSAKELADEHLFHRATELIHRNNLILEVG